MTVKNENQMRDGIVKRGKTFSYVVTLDGRKIWKGGFETRAAAKSARDKARVSILENRYATPSKLTLEDFLKIWIERHGRNLKKKTLSTYESHLRLYVFPRIGHLKMQEIRPSHLENYFSGLLENGNRTGGELSARTVTYDGAILKKAFRYAFEVEGVISSNPASRVALPKGIKSKAGECWSMDHLRIFLEAMKAHRLYPFFHIAAFTGARRGELLALRWSDFDGETLNFSKSRVQAGSVTVEESSTKGGENGQRRVILAIPERKLLEAHRVNQKAELERLGLPTPISNFIFTQPDGSPLYPSTPTALFHKVSRKLNLPPSNLHGLRHLHATALLRDGEPLHVVAQRLGHRDAMVTATIYAHVYDEQAESAAATFSNSFHRGA
jgi:integrase